MPENRNIITFIQFIIILILTIPVILITTALINIDLFAKIGVIGDSIGGMTAPFIGLVSSILVYLSFEQQRIANSMLQTQLDNEKNNEKLRLIKIQELILFDLKEKIEPNAQKIKVEIQDFFDSKQSLKSTNKLLKHVDFNSDIFDEIGLLDCFTVFNKNKKDFNNLCNFYKRVNFISENTLSQIVEKLNQNPANDERMLIKTLEAIIINIDSLSFQIDEFYNSYSTEIN